MTDLLASVFRTFLYMSATAAVAIAVVALVRLPLKKAPKTISCGLWFVVLFRLLCPVSFQSAVSLFTLRNTSSSLILENIPVVSPTAQTIPAVTSNPAGFAAAAVSPSATPEPVLSVMAVLAFIWAIGALGLMLYAVVSYIKTKRSVRTATLVEGNVYESDAIASPFVCGFIRPKIYLPVSLKEDERRYIILHEKTHIKRRDYIVKPVWFLAVCLHWFNPIVWAAYYLLGRDIEMSCDEAVIRKMGDGVRADYSSSLLALSSRRTVFAGSPLAFGESHTFSRIKNVLNYKKPVLWVVILALLAAATTIFVLASNPMDEKETSEAVTVSSAPLGEPSYAIAKLVDGHPNFSLSPAQGDVQTFALRIIEDYSLKSAAWEALDIGQLDACYRLIQSYPDGTKQTYYAFMHNGYACVQWAELGRYSRVDTALYDAFEQSVDAQAAGMSVEENPELSNYVYTGGDNELLAPFKQFVDAKEAGIMVEENLTIIMSSPSYSSRAADYIEAHREGYKAILKLGQPALDYMLSCFENGEGDTLKGHIMMSLCQELLGPQDSLADEALQPSEWYARLQIQSETELPDFVYTGNDPVLTLVYDTETAHYQGWGGGFTVVSPHVFGSYEEDGYLKVFVTTYSASYHLYGQTVDMYTAAVVPAAITYKMNVDGTYTLDDYTSAMDGSLFAPSIRDYCTMPVSGETIVGLADKIIGDYGKNNGLKELQNSNLAEMLNVNGITDAELPT